MSERIARETLSGYLPQRLQHVCGVARSVRSAAALFGEDSDLLEAAALLHDIGYSPVVRRTGFHPLDGALYLRDLDMPDRLCALVARHSCAYLEAKLRGLSVELSVWDDEASSLRDALWWADMTTTPDGRPTTVDARLEEIEQRYGTNDVVSVFIRLAKPDLMAAVERTEERLRAAGLGHLAK
ncbi:HD domain-containing protein [Actinosynnema sp. CA-299493]